MVILRSPAHNLHAAFSLTRVVPSPYSASSASTVLVPSVRAFVPSLLHLFRFIRRSTGFSISLAVSCGLPVYPNKSRPVGTLNPEHSSTMATGHGSPFSFQGNVDQAPRSVRYMPISLKGSVVAYR